MHLEAGKEWYSMASCRSCAFRGLYIKFGLSWCISQLKVLYFIRGACQRISFYCLIETKDIEAEGGFRTSCQERDQFGEILGEFNARMRLFFFLAWPRDKLYLYSVCDTECNLGRPWILLGHRDRNRICWPVFFCWGSIFLFVVPFVTWEFYMFRCWSCAGKTQCCQSSVISDNPISWSFNWPCSWIGSKITHIEDSYFWAEMRPTIKLLGSRNWSVGGLNCIWTAAWFLFLLETLVSLLRVC